MTEADWWATSYPDKLLNWLFYTAQASERKFRLFSLACCRQVGDLLADSAFPQLLVLMEVLADDPVDAAKIERLRRAGRDNLYSVSSAHRTPKWHARNAALCGTGALWEGRGWQSRPAYWEYVYQNSEGGWLLGPFPHVVSEAVFCAHPRSEQAEALAHQLRVIRDLFGPLPFRDITVPQAWLTSDVLALARGIYDEHAFERMPILADALQEAGCDNDDILDHCRHEPFFVGGDAPKHRSAASGHVRGCWVIDLLLRRPWRSARPHPRR
ncbi:hypothetical protein GobsT_68070 [Gemmata obscuriglobus]|uniref:hypothetical protein n=1 Tax=Gemmata obscuriglobus TaxID=114 RepID=UPI00016C565B